MKDMTIFVGPVVHSARREAVTIIPKAAVVVENGKIVVLEELSDESRLTGLKDRFPAAAHVTLKEGQFLIPGLIDSHIHAPQFPNAGLGYDKPLLDWLTTYTFPLEACYQDINYARKVYTAVVNRTLSCGTTTAAYFGTVHHRSCAVLAEAVVSAGQRALVGKVNMDMNSVPELLEETSTSLSDTEEFLESITALQSSLVKPVITPRFAITCSASLMAPLGALARTHNLHIQTHLSENKEEIDEVRRLFPEAKSYADVYDRAGLLTRKTILAHCVHLATDEVSLVLSRGCSVAHCPSSNINLQSGLCDVRALLDACINVALGTDVAGGNTPSMMDVMRSTLSTSISLSFSQPGYRPLTYHEVFYLATMGGAVALDMEDTLGNFAVGKFFDALVVDTAVVDSPIYVAKELPLSELFQKFIYSGDDRNICEVYVNGKQVLRKY